MANGTIIDALPVEDTKLSEKYTEKAVNVENTRNAMLKMLQERLPTEIIFTFHEVSFVIKPENTEVKQLYVDLVDAISTKMVLEKEYYEQKALDEKDKEDLKP